MSGGVTSTGADCWCEGQPAHVPGCPDQTVACTDCGHLQCTCGDDDADTGSYP